MFLTDNLKYDLIGIGVAFLVIYVAYAKWCFTYWKRRGLEAPTPSIPFGNTADLFLGRKAFGIVWKDIYTELKAKGLRHGGAYFMQKPLYIPTDLEIVKSILHTDFQHFTSHGFYVNEDIDPLSANLFNLDGPKWKTTRNKLSPTFTSGKMKMMFQTLVECASGLLNVFDKFADKNDPFDIKDVMGCFTTDIIGSCAFGIDCNTMTNPNSEFRKFGLKAVGRDSEGTLRQIVQFLIPHGVLTFFNFKIVPASVTKFFFDIINKTVSYREKNNISRKDFMHLLIQLKNKGKLDENEGVNKENGESGQGIMTINELVAQSFVFFLAGFETSSTILNFAVYELTANPDMQDRLRNEIITVLQKYDNELTYDGVMEMTYLDKFIQETLRKYPPVPELFRVCTKTYKDPKTDVVIESGSNVMISVLGIHYDPEYYPNPEKFDPDRFNEENKASRPNFTWLPFGEGPRICIGLRFGVLQTKIGLITLVKNFQVSLNKKTKTPLVYENSGLITSAKGGIWIDIHKLNTRR